MPFKNDADQSQLTQRLFNSFAARIGKNNLIYDKTKFITACRKQKQPTELNIHLAKLLLAEL